MTNSEKRKEITDFLVEFYDTIDKKKLNSKKFLEFTKKMTDDQFIAYFTSIVNDNKKHLYIELQAFDNEPDYETLEKAADVVGDNYHHLWDYVCMRHFEDGKEFYTKEKILTGYINIRRVQQIVNHKNSIPTDNNKRDSKTGQVSFESKAARVSDLEQFALICQGNYNILKEMFGPRGGDRVMRDAMEHQIAVSGNTELSTMVDNRLNKTSLMTANTYLTGACLDSNIIMKNGILPKTLFNYDKDVNILNNDK